MTHAPVCVCSLDSLRQGELCERERNRIRKSRDREAGLLFILLVFPPPLFFFLLPSNSVSLSRDNSAGDASNETSSLQFHRERVPLISVKLAGARRRGSVQRADAALSLVQLSFGVSKVSQKKRRSFRAKVSGRLVTVTTEIPGVQWRAKWAYRTLSSRIDSWTRPVAARAHCTKIVQDFLVFFSYL